MFVAALDQQEDEARRQQINALLEEALSGDASLRPLPSFPQGATAGFKLGLPTVPDAHQFFFAVSCTCGTSAVLNLEVPKNKSISEVETAIPGLVGHLRNRARQFKGMPCSMHKSLQ